MAGACTLCPLPLPAEGMLGANQLRVFALLPAAPRLLCCLQKGQLGLGDTINRNNPTIVNGLRSKKVGAGVGRAASLRAAWPAPVAHTAGPWLHTNPYSPGLLRCAWSASCPCAGEHMAGIPVRGPWRRWWARRQGATTRRW